MRPSVRTMLTALGSVPALLIGYRTDVLAWNPMGHALLCGHLPYDAPDQAGTRPNLTRLIFCDLHMRELFADWKAKAQAAGASLRLASGQHPGDPCPSEAGLRLLAGLAAGVGQHRAQASATR